MGMSDHDRPLNARGRDDASRLGTYMARNALVPDHVIVSSALRTRETWELVSRAFERPPTAIYDNRLYDASPQSIFGVIQETGATVRDLMTVGHNPGLQALTAALISPEAESRRRLLQKFPTASLAVIQFERADWASIQARSGRLERFVTARSLRTATG
jgi:phosphohistidine phosphatase